MALRDRSCLRAAERSCTVSNEITLHRDAVDGRFVTREYVKRHPRTTETEHRIKRRPKRGAKGRSKSR